jgi:hypothetical protein
LDSSITGQHSVSRILTAKIPLALTRPGKEWTHENRNHWSRQYWLARSQSPASLVGKIIVDPSNPIALDGEGGFKKIIPADQSSGQIIAGLLSEGAELVKAFCSISVQSLEAAANRKPELAVLFYATDYPEAGGAVAKLIRACQRRRHQPIRPHRSIRRS